MAIGTVATMPVRPVTIAVDGDHPANLANLTLIDHVDGWRGFFFDDDLAGVAVGCGLARRRECELGSEPAIRAILQFLPLLMIVIHHVKHDGERSLLDFGDLNHLLGDQEGALVLGALWPAPFALSEPAFFVGHTLFRPYPVP